MKSSTSLPSGGEWPAQNDYFSKLGDYFDRPEWWDEGAQAIGDFFNQDNPPDNLPDQRLEDLLESFEPYVATEGPVTRIEKDNIDKGLPSEIVSPLPSRRVQELNVRNTSADQDEQSSPVEPQTQKQVVSLVSPPQQETAPGPHDIADDTDSSLFGSRSSSPNAGHAETEIIEPSNNLPFQKEILIDVTLQRPSEPASTNINNAKLKLPSSRAASNERPLSEPGATIADDAIAASLPSLTGTTTITRQTSIQPDSSTHAPSASFSDTVLPSVSTGKNASSPSALLQDVDERLRTPQLPNELNESIVLPQDGEPVFSRAVGTSIEPEDPVQGSPLDEDIEDVKITGAVSHVDPTGIQAIKDEFSEQYGLETGQDSSFISQDDDVTVVHDPSSAATSFFPPNPYSTGPVEYHYGGLPLIEERAASVVPDPIPDPVVQDTFPDHVVQDASLDEGTQPSDSSPHGLSDEKDQAFVQDTIETSTALDPVLSRGELPTSFTDQSLLREQFDAIQDDLQGTIEASTIPDIQSVIDSLDLPLPTPTLEISSALNIRADTPPAPPTSPLTPPPEYLAARLTDEQDAVSGAAEEESDDVETKVGSSIPKKTFLKLGKVTPNKATTTGNSWSGKVFGVAREADDELAHDVMQDQDGDEIEAEIASEDIIERKRKQDQSHADEPPRKKYLSEIPEDDEKSAIETIEPSTVAKGTTNKAKSKMSVHKTQTPVTRSYHRDSTDELALDLPDQPADPPALTPFALNRGKKVLPLAKTMPKKSTPSRPGAKQAAATANSSAPVSETTARPKISKQGGVSKELAALFDSSPPRKAGEKAKADIGSRLRSQPNTAVPVVPRPTAVAAAKQISDTSTTGASAGPKRVRLHGSNPLGGQEISNLGPFAETRTRTRNSTAASTPEATPGPSTKTAPKRVKNAISKHDLENVGAVMESRTRSTNASVEPTPKPAAKATPAKRVRKAPVQPSTKAAVEPLAKANPFFLTKKPTGASNAPRKRALAKKKAVEPEQEEEVPLAKSGKQTKRKRPNEGKDTEEGATRQSKRIAGAKTQEE